MASGSLHLHVRLRGTPDGTALPAPGARAPRRRSVEGCGHDRQVRGRRRAQRARVLHRRRGRRHPQPGGRHPEVAAKRCYDAAHGRAARERRACSATTSLHLLGYHDSGMPDTETNARPDNFANAPLDEAVGAARAHHPRRAPAGDHHLPRRAQLLPAPRPHPRARDLGSGVRRGGRSRGVPRRRASRGSRRSSTTCRGRSRG